MDQDFVTKRNSAFVLVPFSASAELWLPRKKKKKNAPWLCVTGELATWKLHPGKKPTLCKFAVATSKTRCIWAISIIKELICMLAEHIKQKLNTTFSNNDEKIGKKTPELQTRIILSEVGAHHQPHWIVGFTICLGYSKAYSESIYYYCSAESSFWLLMNTRFL